MGGGCSGMPSADKWFDAAKRGDHAKLEQYGQRRFPVDTQDFLGWTALRWATKNGHWECVRILADLGANLDSTETPTAPMLAALEGHEFCLRILAEKRAELDTRDQFGRTAAMLAAQMGHQSCIHVLLEAGADVDLTDSSGQSVAWAFLMSTGQLIDPSIKEMPSSSRLSVSDECPPLKWFAAARRGDTLKMNLLLDKGIGDIDARNDDQETATQLAAEAGDDMTLKFLLDKHANPNKKTKNGRTLAMVAAHFGHDKCLRLLLKARCDPAKKDDTGRTVTMLVCMGGHLSCLEALLKEQPWSGRVAMLLDTKDSKGKTAAMVAAEHGRESCLKFLAEAQANLDCKDIEGMTAAAICASSPRFDQQMHKACLHLIADLGGDLITPNARDGLNALQIYERRCGFKEAAKLVPVINWSAAAKSGTKPLLDTVARTFDRGGASDKRCMPSLHLAFWCPSDGDEGCQLKQRDASLASSLATVVEELLEQSRAMHVDSNGKRLIHVILQVGLLKALDNAGRDRIMTATTRTISELEAELVRRQYELGELSGITQGINEFYHQSHVDDLAEGEMKLDQRDAMPKEVCGWLQDLPDRCFQRLRQAFEAFKAAGVASTTEGFRDFLAMHDLTADQVFYATAAAHIMVGYAKQVGPMFDAFMEDHFRDGRLKLGPLKAVSRVIAKTQEDYPKTRRLGKTAEDGSLRTAYCTVCDIIRCSLKGDGAQDMIAILQQVRGLSHMTSTGKFEVWRIKNTHHNTVTPDQIVGGYRDIKILGRFTAKSQLSNGMPATMIAEIQIIDATFLKVKTFMHRPYSISRGDYNPTSKPALAKVQKDGAAAWQDDTATVSALEIGDGGKGGQNPSPRPK